MDTEQVGQKQPPLLSEIGLDNFTPYLMNRIMGRYNASLRAEMAKLGITTAQMRVLAVLSVHNGILIRDLAVYAQVEQSTLSRALDTLEKQKLIRRKADKQDSRATRIILSAAGGKAFARLWPHISVFYQQMFAGIAPQEQTAFIGTLQKMLANVRIHKI